MLKSHFKQTCTRESPSIPRYHKGQGQFLFIYFLCVCVLFESSKGILNSKQWIRSNKLIRSQKPKLAVPVNSKRARWHSGVHIWHVLIYLQRMFAHVRRSSCGLCVLLLHILLFSPSPLPRSPRESCRSLLPPSSSLSQRDAKAYRSVCQNQRCLGNPSRIPAVDQETGKWAVWGSMDGYAEIQLLFY